jgi:uncharacterized RDD family membrane protein YckC
MEFEPLPGPSAPLYAQPSYVPTGPAPYPQSAYGQQPHPPAYGPPPVVLVNGLPLASPWERLGAYLLDALIIGAVTTLPLFAIAVAVILWIALSVANTSSDHPDGSVATILTAYVLLFSVVAIVHTAATYWYQVVYQGRTGQTIGKRTLKIHLVHLAGAPLTRRHLKRRWLAANAVQILMCIPVLGWIAAAVLGMYGWLDGLWLLWDKPYQQCLHDKYAHTTVVKVPA